MKSTMLRKIDAMHEMFGVYDGAKCKDCSNCVRHRYHDNVLRKCSVYGLTHSEASDWAGKWEACGMFCKEYDGVPIMQRLVKPKSTLPEIEGQLDIFNITEPKGE